VLPGYRIASGVVLALLLATLSASYYGWGLADDATARARNVRQGSVRSRAFYGGGPGFGK
jgi:hypothetical protein